ncbi:MAG: addiction module antidote protein [Gammaproteobacteria bacterium]|nr:addiction module antidote protein [Gammaproteobacteria bacterium]
MRRKKRRLPWRNHEDAVVESFRRNPKFAARYLDAILEDGDQAELMLALRFLAVAFGGMGAVAESAELNKTSLYRTLSASGNPELRSVTTLLKAMGLRLAVQPLARRYQAS